MNAARALFVLMTAGFLGAGCATPCGTHGGDMTTALTPGQIAMKWVAAYNLHDVEAAVALYADDVTNIQMPWGKTVQGREAMRATYENVFRAFPDIRLEAENVIEKDQWAVVEWRFSGTMKGEFAGHAPNHATFSMKGCEVFRIINGKIVTQHGYWDKATMFSQLKLHAGIQ